MTAPVPEETRDTARKILQIMERSKAEGRREVLADLRDQVQALPRWQAGPDIKPMVWIEDVLALLEGER